MAGSTVNAAIIGMLSAVHAEALLPRLHLLLADLDPVVVEGEAVNMDEGEAVNMAGGHDPMAPVVPPWHTVFGGPYSAKWL